MLTWVATAQLYSGRPNPEWIVSEEKSKELERLWEKMPPFTGNARPPNTLGYTGSALTASDGRKYFASKGVITFYHNGITACRLDLDCQYERLLVSSAPEALLPENLLG